ncbi:hypothetical protein P280DRAFT_493080 [Massarina eburnea CBS 473.64]|uniref:Ubiquitin-like domain-containing protein n=1 Tax=Massarina eburnea CBS 473.64 TaxID=1395130 RepID=A0A6A6RMI7_9PLEO|nr:hypothetical protein P280DRAFT_493080 [Massarina eburnea CBS 473.64]
MATTTDRPILPDQLIYLIIRFANATPDLPLPIPQPRTTTTLSLKQLIRPHLPRNNAYARLRLIYAGKVLPDTTPLAVTLRLPPLPPPSAPPRDGTYNEQGPGSKSKGKQAVRDDAPPAAEKAGIPPDAKRYYIHCSLGDALSVADLHSETTLARTTDETLRTQYQSTWTTGPTRGTSSNNSAPHRRPSTTGGEDTTSSATPPPQGFDRLLSTGFTASEVASLRTHFQTNLSYTHTPDTMPSAAEMRALEDRWLDSTATDPAPGAGAGLGGEGPGEAGWGAGFAVEEGGLDDMLWGYLTGFFWPLGALVWGFREEGVWPRRRQLAVVMGVVLNCAFGFMKWSQ